MAWSKGTSGNPRGRPRGIANSHTVRRERLRDKLAKEGPRLIDKAIRLANEGDSTMLSALLDRIVPRLRPVAAPILSPIAAHASAAANAASLVNGVGTGDLSAEDASAALDVLNKAAQLGRVADLERAVVELCGRLGVTPPAELALR